MDKAKILRLCNEIEDEISEAWNSDVIEYDKAGHIVSLVQKIAAEISEPPKSNADRIRQMTDEELFDFLDAITDTCSCWSPQCDNCPMKYKDTSPRCDIQAWLKQEVKTNDER
jgi:hypothetical protein